MTRPRDMSDRVHLTVYVDQETAWRIDINAAADRMLFNGEPCRSAMLRKLAQELPGARDCPDCRLAGAYKKSGETHYASCPRMEEGE